jgi:glucosamine--fructose-6-phosphate aminotransferase (isomerizing)
MWDAIQSQPDALGRVVDANRAALDAAATRLSAMNRVVLAGTGTSWHAALVGELLLAHRGRLGHRVRAFPSFELASYWPALDERTALVVVSHRGSPRFSTEAFEHARSTGGTSILVTGGGHDNLALAEVTLRTVEQETAAAHTASYTAALALLAALAARVGRDRALDAAIERLPGLVARQLAQPAWPGLVERHATRRRYWFVGGGPNTATALEAALKMSEANHASAIGYDTEQFLHGPWAAVERDDLVTIVAPPGPCRERSVLAARAARAIGAAVVALAAEDDRELAALASDVVPLPDVDELLSPIVAVVPLQLFTYHLALARGVNPDIMRSDEPAHARVLAWLSA